MKRVVSLCLAVSLVGVFSMNANVQANTIEDEQWSSPFSATPGLHGLELLEVSGSRTNVSLLSARTDTGAKICSSLSDSQCSGDVDFQAVLERCTATVTIDCIESVVATDINNIQSVGVFERFFPARGVNEYVGSPAQAIPSGKSPSLWNVIDAQHPGGSLYHVAVQLSGRRVSGNATSAPRSIAATITPVSLFQTSCTEATNGTCLDTYAEEIGSDGRTSVRFRGVAADQDGGFRCVGWGEGAQCALKRAFPQGVSFQLKLKLSTSPAGWLHGRMSDPTASISTSGGVTTMIVSALPTKVPAVMGVGQWSSLSSTIQQWFTANCPGQCGTRIGGSLELSAEQRNAVSTPEAFKESSFSQLELWTDHIRDKASALPSYWSVRTLSVDEMMNAPECIKNGKGVTGIVSTNATLYSEGPPSFNTSTKTLNYKVAAPHYEKDGTTEFIGRYDLLLQPAIAQCLYGVDDLAVTSDVKVTGEGGAVQSASTSMVRSAEWFKFSASGYTHSAPTIAVSLAKLRPTLKRGKTVKVSTLAKRVGLKIPKGAKLSVSVAATSKSRCSMSGSSVVKGVKRGSCKLSFSVTPKKTKKVPKPKTIRRTVFVTIR